MMAACEEKLVGATAHLGDDKHKGLQAVVNLLSALSGSLYGISNRLREIQVAASLRKQECQWTSSGQFYFHPAS